MGQQLLRQWTNRQRKTVCTPIGPVIDRFSSKLAGPEFTALDRARQLWGELLGGQLAQHCLPIALKRGTMIVSVDSAAVHFELQTSSEYILQHLKLVRPRLGVSKLRFVLNSQT